MPNPPPRAPRALLLFSHPAPGKSRANRRLLHAVAELEQVTVRDLYDLYPDFLIDVPAEQEQLLQHELIVFQHPFYWYSSPALLKQWLDLVLTHGWAYGRSGVALRGKRAVAAITTGGSQDSYSSAGTNRHTIAELLRPLERSMALCGVRWQEPWILHGVGRLDDAALEAAATRWRDHLTTLLREAHAH